MTALRRFFRALFFLLAAWSSIVWGVTWLPLWTAMHRDRRAHINHIIHHWGRLMAWAAALRVTVKGAEHFPEGPCVIVSNHQGNLDIPVLMGFLPRQFRFVVKQELTRVPIFKYIVRNWGFIPIERKDPDKAYASLQAAAAIVRGGENVLLFPEGTRSADGKLKRFKKGAFVLADAAGVPVVPVAVAGSYKAWPKGRFFGLQAGPMVVSIGAPIPRPEGDDAVGRWLAEAQGEVARMLLELEPSAVSVGAAVAGPT